MRKLLVYDNDMELTQVTVDPYWETADADITNNTFPRQIMPSRVEAYSPSRSFNFERRDIMHDITTELDTDEEEEADTPAEAETAVE